MSPRAIEFPVEGLSDGVVRLRIGAEADVARVTELVHDPDIVRWTTIPAGQRPEQTREWMSRGMAGVASGSDLALVITLVADDKPIGTTGLHEINRLAGRAQCGWVLARDERGKGYAKRAIRLVCAFAFDAIKLDRVEATIEQENVVSRAVAEAVGFRQEGLLRSYMQIAGARRDMLMYSLLPGEIAPPPAPRDATLEG